MARLFASKTSSRRLALAALTLAPLLGPLLGPLLAAPVLAGPVVCTTTLEAPLGPGGEPREVSRCGAVETVPELVQRRFFTYTAPYAEGVSIRGQLRDLFGVATGSINRGDTINVLGFADQTIVWDGLALENTTQVLLEAQGDSVPWRTGDITNGFGCSLGSPTGCQGMTAPARSRTPARSVW